MNNHINADVRHSMAAVDMRRACDHLALALHHEGELEWAPAIREVLEKAQHIKERLVAYAKLARQQ